MTRERARVESRDDDFSTRRGHLASLSDAELKERFWQLAHDIVRPMVDLAQEHTSPSTERSVLLRMGFSGDEAGRIVDGIEDRGLLGKGAGHVLLGLARSQDRTVREAGERLLNGQWWDEVSQLFPRGGVR